MALTDPSNGVAVGVQQQIPSGSQFTGAAPAGAQTFANGLNKFAANVAGGLFLFSATEAVVVHDIYIDFGALTTYSLKIVNLDGSGNPIAGESFALEEDVRLRTRLTGRLLLSANQALQLTTSDATAAMMARMYATALRVFPG
jgi:hypothetical protein